MLLRRHHEVVRLVLVVDDVLEVDAGRRVQLAEEALVEDERDAADLLDARVLARVPVDEVGGDRDRQLAAKLLLAKTCKTPLALVQAGPGWSRLVQAGPGWSRLVQAGPGWSTGVGTIVDRDRRSIETSIKQALDRARLTCTAIVHGYRARLVCTANRAFRSSGQQIFFVNYHSYKLKINTLYFHLNAQVAAKNYYKV